VKEVEGEVDQIGRAPFRQCILQGGEARDAVGPMNRDLAVQISGLDGQRCQRRGDGPEAGRPIQAGVGQQADLAALDPGGGAVAVELDLMKPGITVGRVAHEGRKLGRDELG